MAALIQAWLPLPDEAHRTLIAGLTEPVLRSWRGLEVGRLAPHHALREAAQIEKPRRV